MTVRRWPSARSVALCLVAFLLPVFPKTGIVWMPDIIIGLLFIGALRDRRLLHLLANPFVAILYPFVLISLITPLLSHTSFYKPFWPYHIVRIITIVGAAYWLGLTVHRGIEKASWWFVVGACLGTCVTIVAAFLPALAQVLAPVKFSAYWSPGGALASSNVGLVYRESGMYSSYGEAGNVSAFGFIMAIRLMLSSRRFVVKTVATLLCICFTFGMFIIAYRTAIVIAVVGLLVLLALWFYKVGRNALRESLSLLSAGTFTIFLGIPALLMYSGLLRTIDIGTRILYERELLQFFRGGTPSSLQATHGQVIFPQTIWTWVFGDGLQAWLTGVESDIGYIQLLWGIGFFGTLAFCLFYAWVIMRTWVVYRLGNNSLACAMLGLAIAFCLANYKGLYFVGIRSADLLVFFFSIMLGQHRATSEHLRKAPSQGPRDRSPVC